MFVFTQEVVESLSCQMSASFISFGLGEVDGVEETTGKPPQSPASRPSPLATAWLEGQQLGAVLGAGSLLSRPALQFLLSMKENTNL